MRRLYNKAEIEGIFAEIESESHRQATNMLGISLERSDYDAIKAKYLAKGGEDETEV